MRFIDMFAILCYVAAALNVWAAFFGGVFSCMNLALAVFAFGLGLHIDITNNIVRVELIAGDEHDK